MNYGGPGNGLVVSPVGPKSSSGNINHRQRGPPPKSDLPQKIYAMVSPHFRLPFFSILVLLAGLLQSVNAFRSVKVSIYIGQRSERDPVLSSKFVSFLRCHL